MLVWLWQDAVATAELRTLSERYRLHGHRRAAVDPLGLAAAAVVRELDLSTAGLPALAVSITGACLLLRCSVDVTRRAGVVCVYMCA